MAFDERHDWSISAKRAAEALLSAVEEPRGDLDIATEAPLRDVVCLVRAFARQFELVRSGVWPHQVCLRTNDHLVPLLSASVLRDTLAAEAAQPWRYSASERARYWDGRLFKFMRGHA